MGETEETTIPQIRDDHKEYGSLPIFSNDTLEGMANDELEKLHDEYWLWTQFISKILEIRKLKLELIGHEIELRDQQPEII